MIAHGRIYPKRSRPLHQFYFQLVREIDWVRDGMKYNWEDYEPGAWDLWMTARQNIKAAWIHDGIWSPEWEDQPGVAWMHEDAEAYRQANRPEANQAEANPGPTVRARRTTPPRRSQPLQPRRPASARRPRRAESPPRVTCRSACVARRAT